MIRELDPRIVIWFDAKHYVFSFKTIVQIITGRKWRKSALKNIEKALGFIDKPHNRFSVRRLREPLLKPTVSGYFGRPLLRLCRNFSKFYTKRYISCFKT